MTGIIEWVKNYSMVFLLLTVITSLTAKKEYKRYIQFFVEMLLVVTLITPVLSATGRSEDFFDKISYDSFWQGLDSIKNDQEKLEFLDDEYYIQHYEEIIQKDVCLMAEDAGYQVRSIGVEMNEEYAVENIIMQVEPAEKNRSADNSMESVNLAALKSKIAEYYQMEENRISIRE
ncbi:MAG: stage III sporulation protein AF [Lachnospiraceae bacterium]|nr:stage III sporulation protein AF [Lachnospiraceae bacterium]